MGSQVIISLFQFQLSLLLHGSLTTIPNTTETITTIAPLAAPVVLILQGLRVAFSKRHSRFVNEARLYESYEKGEKFHSYSVVLN
jgi:hypothetical protein